MTRRRVIRLFAIAAVAMLEGSCAMAEPCFTRFDPVLPAREKVRPRLSHGEGGKQIYDAVAAGDEAAVTALLARDPALIRTAVRFADGEEPYNGNDGDLLTFAVASCSPRMVARLLEMGAAPDGERPGAALTYALLADTPDMAEMLLSGGASPDPVDPQSQRAPFATAMTYRNLGAVRMLVRHGLKLDRPDVFGNTYLIDAASHRSFQIAEVLVDAGANPWRIGMGGGTAAYHIANAGEETGDEKAARERLVAKVRKPGLPWPPPAPQEVRERIMGVAWPSPQLEAAGMVVDAAVIARFQQDQGDGRVRERR